MNKSEKLKTCTCVSLLSKSTLKLDYTRYIRGLQFKVLDWMAPCWHFLGVQSSIRRAFYYKSKVLFALWDH